MATEVNQKGYDVVSGDGERISVKTTAMMGSRGHISFNPNTLEQVDRIIILRVNTDEMQIETLLNVPKDEATRLMGSPNSQGKAVISLSKIIRPEKNPSDMKEVKSAAYGKHLVRELENGSIEVYLDGAVVSPAKPELRKLASELNISIVNGSGNPFNTRQLGSIIIKTIRDL